jgi:ABC-2 type transport system permease protein
MAMYVMILPKYLPLSRDRSMSNSSQNIGNVMIMFALIAAVGGLVYACSLLPAWTSYAIGTTAVIVFLMVIKRVRRIPWGKIQV